MTDQHNGNILRVAIAQICKSVGYDKIQASSLAVVQDAVHNFLEQFCRDLHAATEHANRTEVSFNDLLFWFRIQNISVGDLLGFIKQFNPIPSAMNIYQYPLMSKSSPTLIDITQSEEVALPQPETEALEPESCNATLNESSIDTW